MKRNEEFSVEELWSNIEQGVGRYNKLHGGTSSVMRRKIKLDHVRTVDGNEYLSKVVYIHPPQNVTAQNEKAYYNWVKKIVREHLSDEDSKQFRLKWFDDKEWKKHYKILGKALEFDMKGKNSHPHGTIAVYKEAAVELVNHVSLERPKSKKQKTKPANNQASAPSNVSSAKEQAPNPQKPKTQSANKQDSAPSKVSSAKEKESKSKNQKIYTIKRKKVLKSAKPDLAKPQEKKDNAPQVVPEENNVLNEQERYILPFLKAYYDAATHKDSTGKLKSPTNWPHKKGDKVHALPYALYITPPEDLSQEDQLVFGVKIKEQIISKLHSMKCTKFIIKLKESAESNYETALAHVPGVFRAELNAAKYPLGTVLIARGGLALLANFYRFHFLVPNDHWLFNQNEVAPLIEPVPVQNNEEVQNNEKEAQPHKVLSLDELADLAGSAQRSPEGSADSSPEEEPLNEQRQQKERPQKALRHGEQHEGLVHEGFQDDGQQEGQAHVGFQDDGQQEGQAHVGSQDAIQQEGQAHEGSQNDEHQRVGLSHEGQQHGEQQQVGQSHEGPQAQEPQHQARSHEDQQEESAPQEVSVILEEDDFDFLSSESDEELKEVYLSLLEGNRSLVSEVEQKNKIAHEWDSKLEKANEDYKKEKEQLKPVRKAAIEKKIAELSQQKQALSQRKAQLEERIEERTRDFSVIEEKLGKVKKLKLEKQVENDEIQASELHHGIVGLRKEDPVSQEKEVQKTREREHELVEAVSEKKQKTTDGDIVISKVVADPEKPPKKGLPKGETPPRELGMLGDRNRAKILSRAAAPSSVQANPSETGSLKLRFTIPGAKVRENKESESSSPKDGPSLN